MNQLIDDQSKKIKRELPEDVIKANIKTNIFSIPAK